LARSLKILKKVNIRHGSLKTSKFYFGWSETRFGNTLIFLNGDEVISLAFDYGQERFKIEQEIKKSIQSKNATFEQADMSMIIKNIFNSNKTTNILLRGTDFQLKVWNALLEIPFGLTTDYSSIAVKLGKKTAVRAVANAIGKNPIAWLIPCHRVLRKCGNLGGYRWGLNIKKRILSEELPK